MKHKTLRVHAPEPHTAHTSYDCDPDPMREWNKRVRCIPNLQKAPTKRVLENKLKLWPFYAVLSEDFFAPKILS